MDTIASPDETRLDTENIAYAGIAAVQAASSEAEKAALFAAVARRIFDDYYVRSRRIPWLAKAAFERRAWPVSVALSQTRINIFGEAVAKAAPILSLVLREADRKGGFWNTVEERFRAGVAERYEQDLALAFLAALRRRVYKDDWMPVGYERNLVPERPLPPDFLWQREMDGRMTAETVADILALPRLGAPWRDLVGDCRLTAERINAELSLDADPRLAGVEVVRAGFYRNRGAYLVGALDLGTERRPLSLALLHDDDGVHVDAVLTRETTLRHVFSSTLANFHVTVTAYHELIDYLVTLMPTRPRGLHYSTVGYNHVGKLAVIEQVTDGLERADEMLGDAPGPEGSVARAFTAPSSGYVLKVIRDTPTANYKWDRWDGVDAVLDKYRRVHEINRSGSMLDNIIWTNLSLPRAAFDDALIDDLLGQCASSVSLIRGRVFFGHLIAQRKLTPVPLYLERATPEAAEMAVIRLGQCIRNNASSNVFNRDLDGRNYGMSSLGFCYLFDYDAIEQLTDVKIRTNLDRFDGEEDIPEWFFEEGPVFLPEELEVHLRLPRHLRRLFREAHGPLLTLEYWERMQRLLAEGRVPRVRTYPRSTQLRPPA